MDKALLEARAVEKSFRKGSNITEVLRGIDFVVQKGESLAILGESGVGKSTLLHILGSLDTASKGKVLFEGRDLSSYSALELARHRNKNIGFIFQFHYLLREFTALENVLMPALVAGEAQDYYKKIALRLLEEVGLAHRLDHRPAELSGGEQQRVAVARALIMNPRVILADEPTGNLDKENSKHIAEVLMRLVKSNGGSLILVTHNHTIAAPLSQKFLISDGKIVPYPNLE